MVTYADVRRWNPESLCRAADDLARHSSNLRGLGEEVTSYAKPDGWSGVAASAAAARRRHLSGRVHRLGAAVGSARRVLDEAATSVTALKHLIIDADGYARAHGFNINENGDISEVPGRSYRDVLHTAELAGVKAELENRVDGILSRARAIDRTLAAHLASIGGSGDNSGDGPTGTSLGPHQAAWCARMGPIMCSRAYLLQRKALKKTNGLKGKYWTPARRNAFRHAYWIGLLTVHGFSYDLAIDLGEAHEQDTDKKGERPGSKDSKADLHNNEFGARTGVDIRPWYVAAFGVGATSGHERELEERIKDAIKDGSLKIVKQQ